MRYLILFLTLFSATETFSCDCDWNNPFLKLTDGSALIFQFEVLGHEKLDHDFDEILVAKVLKLYKGDLTTDTVRLHGDNGYSCSPYVSKFKTGEKYIVQIEFTDLDYLWLTNCGEMDLEIKGDTVNPNVIEPGRHPQTMKTSLTSFEEALRENLGEDANFRVIEHKTKTPFDRTIVLLVVLGLIVVGWIYKRKQRHHNNH